jgi:hypothetical protein
VGHDVGPPLAGQVDGSRHHTPPRAP